MEKCKICGLKFKGYSGLLAHTRKMVDLGNKKYEEYFLYLLDLR